jgi:hypothetical protein
MSYSNLPYVSQTIPVHGENKYFERWTISSAEARERRQITSIGKKGNEKKRMLGGVVKLCKFIAGELDIRGNDGGVEG